MTQVQSESTFVEATQEVLELIKEIDQINDTYRTLQEPHTTKIYAGRNNGFRSFEPSESARDVANFGPSILLAFVGLVFLCTPYRQVAAIFLSLAIVVGALFRLKPNGNSVAYQELEKQRRGEIKAIHDKIRRALSRGSSV